MDKQDLKLPGGLHVRPSNSSATDRIFLEKLHRERRDDLRLIEGEQDFIESLIDMQFQAMNQGYGEQFPNALYFIIEYHQSPVGRAVLDFSQDQVHLIDIVFTRQARGHGLGEAVIRSFMYSANQLKAPMTLSVQQINQHARQLYLRLGFSVTRIEPPYERMIWYPPSVQPLYAGMPT
ncbi:GNAT family N-acetyltransferase [Photobacterium sp. WH77]|uniref:GNAT family N-acetyltransferase n=1 Tax=Photobacterium arenosum TaxID=2774143 RepID=A0ABR9BHY8_9GAMM|nr:MULTISPECIES: GNAT family N-acetyltransferase [Photobacterium]MBD8512067.1 GNAT family N-acetyltransferase [Photobacterium arenosum]MBV7261746.1 GNAT family N-acetyltransferase [Photobacterium sp. WH24]MCG2836125.1 GNAT family N-acetyltransferase [Photobacterium sp. WH77]MCG2843738.1 GNAT family N-acetyltransferase [Photobacterium sp. WH80]